MADLFDGLDEQKRERLRALGWIEVIGWRGTRTWVRPDDARFVESEAFRQLEVLAEAESCGGETD